MGISSKARPYSGDLTVTDAGAYALADESVQADDIELAQGSMLIGAATGAQALAVAAGSMVYGGATDIAALAKGTANQYLSMNAGATAPEWVTPARGDLAQEALEVYSIPLHSLRAADGASLGVADTEDAGDHYLSFASNVWKLMGNSPNSDDQTDVSIGQFALPPEYDDGQTITLRVNALYTADGDEKTVDVEVYKVGADGSVGLDICETAAQTLTGTAANHDFTVTPTGLVGGDLLNFKITTVFGDDDGTTGEAQINRVAFLLDIKG